MIEYIKTKKSAERKKYQLLIYLLRGNLDKGQLRVTSSNEVILELIPAEEKELIESLYTYLKGMEAVSNLNHPPKVQKQTKCGDCNFNEYCWGGK